MQVVFFMLEMQQKLMLSSYMELYDLIIPKDTDLFLFLQPFQKIVDTRSADGHFEG